MKDLYEKTIQDLNEQVYVAYKRIKELTDELYSCKKVLEENNITVEEKNMSKKTKKKEVPTITDLQLVFVNRVKDLVMSIHDANGVEYVTYSDVSKLDKAFDDVVEEANLKHQQMTIEHGENKGEVYRASWQDLVRADHPNIYVEKDDE